MNLGTTARAAITVLPAFLISVGAAAAAVAQDASQQDLDGDPRRAVDENSAHTKHPAGTFDPRRRVAIDRESVYYDGAAHALGATYKADFDARGATYTPFFGSSAPRNYPITFRLESASVGGRSVAFDALALPQRTGDTVSFDRGSLVEIYELSPRSMEQKLVFAGLPSGGDLVVRYAVESELAPAAAVDGSGAIEFENELGAVRYGKATALDAMLVAAPAETRLVDGGIEIVVPESFLSRAAFPLTIDPIYSTVDVDLAAWDFLLPDVAYDETQNKYLVVGEAAFSASDHYVVAQLLTSSGTRVASNCVDCNPGSYWSNPKVANSGNDTFLAVAQVGHPSSGARVIRGRVIQAAPICCPNLAMGNPITISLPDQIGDKLNPDVGGDPGGSQFAVVWERVYSSNDRDIHAQAVSGTNGSLVHASTQLVDDSSSTEDTLPSISNSCGNVGAHHVAWQRRVGVANHDIRAAELRYDAIVVAGSTPIVTGISDAENPAVSSLLPDMSWLLVHESSVAGGVDHDIKGVLMTGVAVIHSVNVSSLEDPISGTLGESQIHPAADSDGGLFTVAYAESYQGSSTDFDIYLATLTAIGGRLFLAEGHVNAAYSSTLEDHPKVGSMIHSSGPRGMALAVWDDQVAPGDHNVEGALYESEDFTSFCWPGQDAIACPCGNPPSSPGRGCNNSSSTGGAILTQSGTGSILHDTVVFTTSGERPTATSIVLQGSALVNTVYGQGVRCAGGTLKRLYVRTASGGSITAPTLPNDPTVSQRSGALGQPLAPGATRYYSVYYRDPNVLGGCSPASTFNSTQSGAITWRP